MLAVVRHMFERRQGVTWIDLERHILQSWTSRAGRHPRLQPMGKRACRQKISESKLPWTTVIDLGREVRRLVFDRLFGFRIGYLD